MLLAVRRHDLASAGSVPSTYWLSVAMQDAPRQHLNASQCQALVQCSACLLASVVTALQRNWSLTFSIYNA